MGYNDLVNHLDNSVKEFQDIYLSPRLNDPTIKQKLKNFGMRTGLMAALGGLFGKAYSYFGGDTENSNEAMARGGLLGAIYESAQRGGEEAGSLLGNKLIQKKINALNDKGYQDILKEYSGKIVAPNNENFIKSMENNINAERNTLRILSDSIAKTRKSIRRIPSKESIGLLSLLASIPLSLYTVPKIIPYKEKK